MLAQPSSQYMGLTLDVSHSSAQGQGAVILTSHGIMHAAWLSHNSSSSSSCGEKHHCLPAEGLLPQKMADSCMISKLQHQSKADHSKIVASATDEEAAMLHVCINSLLQRPSGEVLHSA